MISWVTKDARTIPNILFITELTELYHFSELQESYRIKLYSTPFDRCPEQVEWNQNTWFTNVWQAVCQKISYRFKSKMIRSFFFKKVGIFRQRKRETKKFNEFKLFSCQLLDYKIFAGPFGFPAQIQQRKYYSTPSHLPLFFKKGFFSRTVFAYKFGLDLFQMICVHLSTIRFIHFEQISRFNWSQV